MAIVGGYERSWIEWLTTPEIHQYSGSAIKNQ